MGVLLRSGINIRINAMEAHWITQNKEIRKTNKKLMATVFWDADGVIHVGYMAKRNYYEWAILR